MSLFNNVSIAPADPIFGLIHSYLKDPRPEKVSFLIGFFRDSEGKTPLMKSVKEAEQILLQKTIHKEYLPIDGNQEFVRKIAALLFGESLWTQIHQRIYGAQTIGGTGALRTLGDFFFQQVSKTIWISDPTWPNHGKIFRHAGLQVEKYPYYDRTKIHLEFERMMDALKQLPKQSIVVFHANAHNPTGVDLSKDQWKEISKLFLSRNLFPFFDAAYQGFGHGLDEDAFAVRLFAEQGHEMAVAYSCSKNFSLYGERMGALLILSQSSSQLEAIQSQIKSIIRSNYSNPPRHGEEIIIEVLSQPSLREKWQQELFQMRKRMLEMRQEFVSRMKNARAKRDFSFALQSQGLFFYTGLNSQQVEKLRTDYAIYMPSDGRVNVTALNEQNFDHVIHSLLAVM